MFPPLASLANTQATCGIQFYPGINEPCIPSIRVSGLCCCCCCRNTITARSPLTTMRSLCIVQLTRSRDGTNGVAYFDFDQPSMFDSKENQEDVNQEAITAMRMVDAEGEISSTDVSARFVNGQPTGLAVTYIMQSSDEWDRFMRFMDNYAESNELGFAGGGSGGGGGGGGGSDGARRTEV